MHSSTLKVSSRLIKRVNKKQFSKKQLNTNEINILTYNLCWGCMSANDKSQFDITAKYLAVKCEQARAKSGQQQCATNITNNIIAAFTKNTKTGICDILALQEATNWRMVYDGLIRNSQTGFSNLGYIHHLTRTETGALAELCTIYNRAKFRPISVAIGDIGNGRPFQIIRFKWRQLGRELIVINLHNSHRGSANVIQSALSNNRAHKIFTKFTKDGCLNAGIYESGGKLSASSTNPTSIDNHSSKSLKNTIHKILQTIPQGILPLILFMGDTNDHGNFKLWRGFVPITNIAPGNLGKVSSQSRIHPTKSCCAPIGNSSNLRTSATKEDSMYGDYILTSDNFRYLVNNKIPTVGINHNATYYPASDHLPVLSTVVPRLINNTNR